jgi:hypothetical protein
LQPDGCLDPVVPISERQLTGSRILEDQNGFSVLEALHVPDHGILVDFRVLCPREPDNLDQGHVISLVCGRANRWNGDPHLGKVNGTGRSSAEMPIDLESRPSWIARRFAWFFDL